MERRNFLKGLGALGVTLGFGSRVISKEADRLSETITEDVVQTTVNVNDTLLDSSEFFINVPDEVIALSAPEAVESLVDPRLDPLTLWSHDWSKELGNLLEKDFEVHEVAPGASMFQWVEPIKPTLYRKNERDYLQSPESITHQSELEHMYCAFIIKDGERSLSSDELRELFFLPALRTFKMFIEEESEGKRLAVQRLTDNIPGGSVKAHTSNGGPIPIRTTMMYDIPTAGTRVNMEFKAKVY